MVKMNRIIRIFGLLFFCVWFQTGQMKAQTNRMFQHTTGRFRIVFEGIEEFRAIKISGIESETVVDLTEEPSRIQPQRQLKSAHLVIVREAIPPDDMWEWRSEIINGRRDIRAGRIDLLDQDSEPVLTWEITNSWPFKWVWPVCDANHPEPAVEEIHVVAEEIRPAGDRVISLPVLPTTIQMLEQ